MPTTNEPLIWPDKDPDDVTEYYVDWAGFLIDDTIAASIWVLPDGLTQAAAPSFDAGVSKTIIRLSGGEHGAQYAIINRVTTTSGQVFDRAIWLRVVSAGSPTAPPAYDPCAELAELRPIYLAALKGGNVKRVSFRDRATEWGQSNLNELRDHIRQLESDCAALNGRPVRRFAITAGGRYQ